MNKQTKIITYDRWEMETLASIPFPPNIAVISVADTDLSPLDFRYKPKFLLQLAFDDVDADIYSDNKNLSVDEKKSLEEKYHMISDEQALQIAKFYHKVRQTNIDTIICQCEHGQSRSAAIKAAIMEYEEKCGIDVFADDELYPNKTVFKRVLKKLIERKTTEKEYRKNSCTL